MDKFCELYTGTYLRLGIHLDHRMRTKSEEREPWRAFGTLEVIVEGKVDPGGDLIIS